MSWTDTAIAVSSTPFVMGAEDREALAFDAQETVVSAAGTLVAINGGTATTPTVGLLEGVVLTGTVATATVSGLARGQDYELRVTFARADGTRWTRTLLVRCAY